jgi:hypothetical protein
MSSDRRASSASATPTAPKKSERGKLLLIPILGGVLLYVVFGSGDSAEPVPDVEPAALTKPSAQTVDAPAPQRPAVPAWPDHPLEHILAHDPFVPHDAQPTAPAETPATAPRAAAAGAETASGLTVSAIFSGPKGMTAVIDGQPVRVGDELAGGLMVTRIDADGVEVAPRPNAGEAASSSIPD